MKIFEKNQKIKKIIYFEVQFIHKFLKARICIFYNLYNFRKFKLSCNNRFYVIELKKKKIV
jgi:hypothetical protein